MNPLSDDPRTPATRGQELAGGIAALVAGIAFTALAGLTIVHTHSSGRLADPAVIFLIGLMGVFGVGFLGIAFAVLRSKKKQKAQLMGRATLYVAGGFLVLISAVVLLFSLWQGAEVNWEVVRIFGSLAGIGLLAVRLGRIRGKNIPDSK